MNGLGRQSGIGFVKWSPMKMEISIHNDYWTVKYCYNTLLWNRNTSHSLFPLPPSLSLSLSLSLCTCCLWSQNYGLQCAESFTWSFVAGDIQFIISGG
jgi:hypothetical protein